MFDISSFIDTNTQIRFVLPGSAQPNDVFDITIFTPSGGSSCTTAYSQVLFGAITALVLAPLAHYWLTHPGSFLTRTQQIAAASWAEVWAGIRTYLEMFFLRGDPYIRFNLPCRPIFDPLTTILFLLGLTITIWQFVRLLRGAPPRAPRSPSPCHLLP